MATVSTPIRRPYHALQHRDFRRMWAAQLVSLTGSQMQVVAINWHVYLLTRSPLALGFVGLTRVVPIVGFSLLGGIVADRSDRRRVLMVTQAAMTVVAIGLALMSFTRHDAVWMIYGLNALSAAPAAGRDAGRLTGAEEAAGARLALESAPGPRPERPSRPDL